MKTWVAEARMGSALPSLQNPPPPNPPQPLRKGTNTSLCWKPGQRKAIQHPTAGQPQLSGPMKPSTLRITAKEACHLIKAGVEEPAATITIVTFPAATLSPG